MPYKILKRRGARPWKIVKQLPGGGTRTVGSSRTKREAQRSAKARMAADHGWNKGTNRRR